MLNFCETNNRCFIEISGNDAKAFLQRIITQDLPELGAMNNAALLTPQGKIITDFFIWCVETEQTEQYIIDISLNKQEAFITALKRYILRAKVNLKVSAQFSCINLWQTPNKPLLQGSFVQNDLPTLELGIFSIPQCLYVVSEDRRKKSLGWRVLIKQADNLASEDKFNQAAEIIKLVLPDNTDIKAARWEEFAYCEVAIGVIDIGEHLESGKYFSHELGMIESGAINLTKGCYVGQEIVSRVHHRSTEAGSNPSHHKTIIIVSNTSSSTEQWAEITKNHQVKLADQRGQKIKGVVLVKIADKALVLARGADKLNLADDLEMLPA